MTEPTKPSSSGLPPAHLAVPVAEVSPGQPSTVVASLTSSAPGPCSFAVSVHGLEAGWVEVPALVGPVEPGGTLEVPVEVRLPVGHPACTLVGVVSARAVGADRAPASPPSPAATADLVVTVGDGSLIQASLDPAEVRGWRRGRLQVVVRNRGGAPTRVELSGIAPDPSVGVRFAEPAPVLPPGEELRVAARVDGPRRLTGGERRRPFGVRVQGRATPVVLEGSFLQRPVFSASLVKLTSIVLVAALWIAAAVVGIGALSSHVQKGATANGVASSPPVGPASSPAGGAGAPSGGASGGSVAGSPAGAGPATGTVRVGGRVVATQPGGVTVTIAPTSLADPSSVGATPVAANATLAAAQFVTSRAGGSQALGKVYGTMVGATFDAGLTAAAGVPTMSTTTTPDGSWAINGLRAPGTYLVTFSKPGFTTRKYLLTAATPGTTLQLNATISPGDGSISGVVTGPEGGLGGVSVTLTDGTVTLTTRTPSVGPGRGDWALTGLTTPDVYLVTATKPGYGTETTLVTLAASGSAHGVRLALRPGVGSISGTVVSARSATGIGGVTVTATDGSTTESTTTTTVGKVGSYLLPNLPIPGTYALTVSGAGWVTQTRQVHLTSSAVVGASLTAAGADVVGFAYDKAGNGLGAAGVVLKNGSHTFKTLTQSTAPVGRFDFSQVPAGTYVLTVEDYGYATESAQVVVSPGAVSTQSLVLPAQPPQSLDTGTIRGSVNDLFDATGVPGVSILLDGTPVATSGSGGSYQVNDVPPGVHVVTAAPTLAQGFEPASTQVNVPLGGTVFAPVLELPKLDALRGTVTSAAGTGPVSGASVQLLPAGATVSSTTGTTGGTTSTLTSTSAATTTSTTSPSATATGTGPPPAGGSTASTTTSASGTYALANLVHGNYQLVVSAPGYKTDVVDVTLAVDENLNENVSLTLEPSFNVVTYAQSSGSGGLAQVGGVCVTVTGPGYNATELSSATKPVSFTPLVAGQSYKATFWQPAPTAGSGPVAGVPPLPCPQDNAQIGTAPSTTFTAKDNNAAIYSAFLAPQLPAVSVALTFQYELQGSNGVAQTVDCPVVTVAGAPSPSPACPTVKDAPAVSITGITSFTTTSDGTLGSPVYSAPIPAVAPTGTTSDVWTFPASALSALVSDQVTVHVDGTGTPLETITPSETLSGTGTAALSFILTPTPVVVTGSVTPATGATITIDPGQIPLSTQQNGTSPATITATDTSGSLVWGDTQVGTAGLAQPGVYTVSATAPGYDPGSTPVNVGVVGGVLTGAPVTVTLDLAQQTTLTVSETGYAAVSGLAGPTVYLLYDGQPVTASNGGAVSVTDGLTGVASSSYSQQLSGATDTAVFRYLSPAAEATAATNGKSGYSLVVVTPGYQTWFSPVTGLTPSMTVNATPVQESVITGTVDGTIDGSAASGLTGANVTATLNSGSCPTAPTNAPSSGYTAVAPATVSVTSGASGAFELTGDATLSTGSTTANLNGGLCPGASYTITASLNGYTSASTTVTVAAGADPLSAALSLAANPITQEFDVSPPTGNFSKNALPTISVSSALGTSFVCQDGVASSGCSVPASGSGANFAVTVYPTAYNYTISAPGYEPLYLSAISYAPGATPPLLSETLQPQNNEITGTVTATAANSSTATTVPGLLVNLYSAADNSLVGSATTSSKGVYTISNVASGSYYAEPAPTTGYADATTPVTFSTAYPATATTDNLSVQGVAPTTTTVTVTTTASTANLAGATVTLTPVAPPHTLPGCANSSGSQPLLVAGLGQAETGTVAASGSGSGTTYQASISSVVPDYYSLVVSSGGSGSASSSIPTQTAVDIEICPTTNPSAAATTTFAVQEGEIDGTLTLTPASAQSPSVAITSGATTEPAPKPTCSSSSSDTTCTYTAYEPLGAAYTATATLAGYTTSSETTPTLSSSAAQASLNGTMTQGAISGTITLSATSSTNPTVTITPTASTGSTETAPCPVASGATTCTYSAYEPIGGTYSVTASLSGDTATPSSISWAPTAASPTTSGADFTLAPTPPTTTSSTTTTTSSTTPPPAPTVTGVSPNSGPASGATPVTITGTGFTSGSTVDFGSSPATNVTFGSSTSITATSPSGTSGAKVDVTVTTASGTSATSSADTFTYN